MDPVRWVPPLSFLLVGLLSSAPAARATDCGNVTELGLCQDAKTLVFCEEGELEVVRCQSGEVCSFDERFDGAAACIATRYAGCGAVPEQGLCAGSTLLYCANARVEERECAAGTHCQAVDIRGEQHFDCVAVSGVATEPADDEETPVEPGDDVDGVEDSTPVDPDGETPLPSVQKGGAGPASSYSAGGGSCAGGAGGIMALALGIAARLFRRLR